jgi:hypothetical protein
LFGGKSEQEVYLSDTWVMDIARMTWFQYFGLEPSGRPQARYVTSMATVRPGQVILFGGCCDSSGNMFGDTWTFSSGTIGWVKLPIVGPPARYSCNLAQLLDGVVLLYGGSSVVGQSNQTGAMLQDTWIFFSANSTWVKVTSPVNPPPAASSAMAKLSDGVVALFACGALDNPLYIFDLPTLSWRHVLTPVTPTPRCAAQMASLTPGSVALTGGANFTSAGYGAVLDDVWLLNSTTLRWTLVRDPNNSSWPVGRFGFAMANAGPGRVVVAGGQYTLAGPLAEAVCVFSDSRDDWQDMSSTAPGWSPRSYAFGAAVGLGRAVIFGGRSSGNEMSNETWVYDLDTSWVRPPFPPIAPEPRDGGAFAPAGIGKLVIFGGMAAEGGSFGDTWMCDLTDNKGWTRLETKTAPSPRICAAAAGVGQCATGGSCDVVLFGGVGGEFGSGVVRSDVWLLDPAGGGWRDLTPEINGIAPPPLRSLPAVGLRRQMCIFGGSSNNGVMPVSLFFNDVWCFDLAGRAWTVFGGVVDSPTWPSPRVGAALSALTDTRFVMFGGINANNLILSDIWLFDTAVGAFILLEPEQGHPTPSPRCWPLFIPLVAGCANASVLVGGASQIYPTRVNLGDSWILRTDPIMNVTAAAQDATPTFPVWAIAVVTASGGFLLIGAFVMSSWFVRQRRLLTTSTREASEALKRQMREGLLEEMTSVQVPPLSAPAHR